MANPQLENWIRTGALRPMVSAEARASGSDDARATRVLVPGCGSGHEVALLAEWGFDVTAVDFAPAALEQTRARLHRLMQSGDGQQMTRVELIEHNLIDYAPTVQFDAIYEQACLCSIYPDNWVPYAENLSRWLKPGGRLFALFVQMIRAGASQGVIEGPPYHCDVNAMRALFPVTRWEWPKPPYDRVPHPAAMAELSVMLVRRG
jgi:SAM-dependent methyltransferase